MHFIFSELLNYTSFHYWLYSFM